LSSARLAILGASARAAAFSALRAGFDVVTADLFADDDLRSRCRATRIENYPHALADWLARQEVDGWIYTGGLENYPNLIDRMASLRPLWGNAGEPLRNARHPLRLQKLCTAREILFPETRLAAGSHLPSGDWLVKTYRGSSGMGVARLDSQAALRHAVAKGAFLQRIAPGAPRAATYVVNRNVATLIGVTEQLVGCPEFVARPWTYCGSLASSTPPSQAIAEQLERVGQLLVDLHLRGLVGVDLLMDERRLWLIEINPRYTASVEVVESALDRPAITQHVESLGSPLKGSPGNAAEQHAGRGQQVRAKAILFAQTSCTVGHSFSQWALEQSAAGQLADIPAEGTRIEPGHPVLTLFEQADAKTARKQLASRAEALLQRLAK